MIISTDAPKIKIDIASLITSADNLQTDTNQLTQQNSDLQNEANQLNGTIGAVANLDVSAIAKDLKISAVSSIMDCAKNIEDRLVDAATKKALSLILSIPNAVTIIGAIGAVQSYVNLAKTILSLKPTPQNLIAALASISNLTGAEQLAKINEVTAQFGAAVDNIGELIANIGNIDICSAPNINTQGGLVGSFAKDSLDPPKPFPQYNNIVVVDNAQIETKDRYDDLMFRVKDIISKDTARTAQPGYSIMISVLNGLVLSYHTKISKTTDTTKDEPYYAEYLNAVEIEKVKNASWDPLMVSEFMQKAGSAGRIIKNEADIIRTFYMRNGTGPVNGSILSTGVTTYSGPDKDFTTFLDIKPEQRPPELTAKYIAEGKNIPAGNTYTNSKGKTFRIGTLNLSDAYTGSYGNRLESDKSCASTRVPGGSILALKNPDGTAYNPTGKNPQGIYVVEDTGNAELTYKKVDIFTSTPELYKNMQGVHVYLVSRGNKVNAPQYKLAQRKFSNSNMV